MFNERGALALDFPIRAPRLPGAFIARLPDRNFTARIAVETDNGAVGATRFQVSDQMRVVAQPVVLAAVGYDTAHEDRDGDGILDLIDNCPTVANHDQQDSNGDGTGDACEAIDLGTSVGCSGSFIFCEDFEGLTLDVNNWPPGLRSAVGGSMAIDRTVAHSGMGSLRVVIDPASAPSQANLTITQTRAVPPGVPFYARAFVRVPSALATTTLLRVLDTGTVDDIVAVAVRIDGGTLGVDVGLAPNGLESTTRAIQFDKWNCITLGYEPNGTAAIVSLYADDGSVISSYSLAAPPSFASTSIGVLVDLPAGFTGANLWFDDVAVDNKRISCAQ
jgi:hypothetical protein